MQSAGTSNYARHESGEVIFFDGEPPRSLCAPRWAFWRLPSGHQRRSFLGTLIGETSDDRCARLDHRPRACLECKQRAALR